jgi:hypothetical protein
MPNEDQATEVLFDRGTLMDLYIGKPTFQKKLRQTDILMEGIDNNALYLGHKFLLSKTATEDLVNIEGRARRALSDKSIEFPLSGARFVYYRALTDVLLELKALRDEWNEAVADLIRRYPELKQEQLAVLDSQYERLMQNELAKTPAGEQQAKRLKLTSWLEQQKLNDRNLYPPAESLRQVFHFEWRMFKISALSGMEEMSSLSQDALLEAQTQLRQDLQHWVRSASVEMHRALGEAAANSLTMLTEKGKLNPRNLKPLFDAFDTFKAIDFTGASNFREVVDRMRSTFGLLDAQGNLDYEQIAFNINNTAGMDTFRSLLTKISELAVDQVAETAGLDALRSVGEFKRVIEV